MRGLFRKGSAKMSKSGESYKAPESTYLPGITPRSPSAHIAAPKPHSGSPGMPQVDESLPAPPQQLERPAFVRNFKGSRGIGFDGLDGSKGSTQQKKVPSFTKPDFPRRNSVSSTGSGKVIPPALDLGSIVSNNINGTSSSSTASLPKTNTLTSTVDKGKGPKNSSKRETSWRRAFSRGRSRSNSIDATERVVYDPGQKPQGGLLKRIFSGKKRTDSTRMQQLPDGLIKLLNDDDEPLKQQKSNADTHSEVKSSARSSEQHVSARSSNQQSSTGTEDEDEERLQLFLQTMLSTDPKNPVSMSFVDSEMKRVPEIRWILKCAINAPLPPFWQHYQPPGKDEFPYYTNQVTSHSRWSHPCDDFFQQIVQVLQSGSDIRGQMQKIYTSVLQNAEQMTSQWQGPYYDGDASYYHNLMYNRSSWSDPFASANYQAEVCVKLLQVFGSRADVLETTSTFAKRKEMLRKHRNMLEQEVGPLNGNELAYLYGSQSLPGAVPEEPSPHMSRQGNPHGSVHHNPHAAENPYGNPQAQQQVFSNPHAAYPNQQQAYQNPQQPYSNPHTPQTGFQNPQFPANYQANLMMQNGAMLLQSGMMMQHQSAAAMQAAAAQQAAAAAAYQNPYANPYAAHQMAQQPYNPSLNPAMNPYGIPGQGMPGHQQMGQPQMPPQPGHIQPQHQMAPEQQQHHQPQQYSIPPPPQIPYGISSSSKSELDRSMIAEKNEWFHNDRNFQRCNSRDDRRKRSTSRHMELATNLPGNFPRCDSRDRRLSGGRIRSVSRDQLPALPDPVKYMVNSATDAGGSGTGLAANARKSIELSRESIEQSVDRMVQHGVEDPQVSIDNLMRKSREYADHKLHEIDERDERSIYSMGSGGEGRESDAPLTYSDSDTDGPKRPEMLPASPVY